jgi:hypothetical protein
MNKLTARRFTTGLLSIASIFAPLAMHAELHSGSKELVVMEPHDLPEQAQHSGNSLFLHSDNAGSTYLYVEQEQGARLSVFDVTDPSRIKLVSIVPLSSPVAFDFVRPLDNRAELVRFRDNKSIGILDLHKPSKPTLRLATALADLEPVESLGETGFLAVDEPYNYVPAVPRDYHIVDTSTSSTNPAPLTTVKQVKHQLVNSETGTTFLLGSDGLTVVRRLSAENDYKIHLVQMKGN